MNQEQLNDLWEDDRQLLLLVPASAQSPAAWKQMADRWHQAYLKAQNTAILRERESKRLDEYLTRQGHNYLALQEICDGQDSQITELKDAVNQTVGTLLKAKVMVDTNHPMDTTLCELLDKQVQSLIQVLGTVSGAVSPPVVAELGVDMGERFDHLHPPLRAIGHYTPSESHPSKSQQEVDGNEQ